MTNPVLYSVGAVATAAVLHHQLTRKERTLMRSYNTTLKNTASTYNDLLNAQVQVIKYKWGNVPHDWDFLDNLNKRRLFIIEYGKFKGYSYFAALYPQSDMKKIETTIKTFHNIYWYISDLRDRQIIETNLISGQSSTVRTQFEEQEKKVSSGAIVLGKKVIGESVLLQIQCMNKEDNVLEIFNYNILDDYDVSASSVMNWFKSFF
jgi:hypothetical protein